MNRKVIYWAGFLISIVLLLYLIKIMYVSALHFGFRIEMDPKSNLRDKRNPLCYFTLR